MTDETNVELTLAVIEVFLESGNEKGYLSTSVDRPSNSMSKGIGCLDAKDSTIVRIDYEEQEGNTITFLRCNGARRHIQD